VSFSQTITGTVSGTLKDPAGAVVPGADVTLINQTTGATQKTTTNELGLFVFPSVLPGTYSLEASASGFKTLRLRDITVTANERRSLG